MSSRECDSPRPTVISKHCVRDPTLAECTLGAAAESRVLTPCPPLHDVESRRSFAPAAPSATAPARLRRTGGQATPPLIPPGTTRDSPPAPRPPAPQTHDH